MKKETVFLDANILFSMAYGSAGLGALWERSKKGVCRLIASRYVIEEARRNLTTEAQLNRLNSYLPSLHVVSEADPDLPCPIDLPEKDIPVFMAAVSADADYLITGDVTHFGKFYGKSVMGVCILMARDYLSPKIS